MSVLSVVCCQVKTSGTGRFLVYRTTECVCVCVCVCVDVGVGGCLSVIKCLFTYKE